jgi:hypothetical protein
MMGDLSCCCCVLVFLLCVLMGQNKDNKLNNLKMTHRGKAAGGLRHTGAVVGVLGGAGLFGGVR